jgi:hypothetical protein
VKHFKLFGPATLTLGFWWFGWGEVVVLGQYCFAAAT